MGVFALMTVLVLAGSGGKTRLEGSVGYPEAGPLPDMVAPGSTPTAGVNGVKHTSPSKSGAAGSLETVSGATATFAGASSLTGSGGSTSTGSSGTRNGASSTGKSSAGKSSSGKGSVQTGGGKTTGSGGKTGGSGGGKGSGGGTKPGGSTGGSGGSTGSHPGGSTGGSGGSTGGSGGSGGSHPGGSTGGSGGSTGGHTWTSTDRAEFLKRLEQQLAAWRAQLAEREREYAQRLAEQRSHNYQHDYPRYTPYTPRDTHTSSPSPSGHAYGRDDSHGRHGH
jgi:hypothetical protein